VSIRTRDIVKAISEGTIEWEATRFGYEVASVLPGLDDPEILQLGGCTRPGPYGRVSRARRSAQGGAARIPGNVPRTCVRRSSTPSRDLLSADLVTPTTSSRRVTESWDF